MHNKITRPVFVLVRLPTNAFRLCFQIVLIAGSIDNNAPGFIRDSCVGALFADRVVDGILFSRLIAVDRRNQTVLQTGEANGKLGEKNMDGAVLERREGNSTLRLSVSKPRLLRDGAINAE